MRTLKITEQFAKKKSEKEPTDLIKLVKDAHGEIQKNYLIGNELNQLPALVLLSEKFNMNLERSAMFATIYCLTETESNLNENRLYLLLKNYFNNEIRKFRIEFRNMKRIGYLYMFKGANSEYLLTIDSKFVQALDENNLDYFQKLGPQGLEESLDFFKKKALDHDTLSESDVDGFIGDIDNTNPDLSLVKYCEEKLYFVAPINSFVLYAICAKAMVDSEGFDFSYMDVYVQYGRKEINHVRKRIINGTWDPIEDKLVEIQGGNHIEHNPTLRLTTLGYNKLLKELDPEVMQLIRSKMGTIKTPMIQPIQIQKVALHFSQEFTENTERISQLLTHKSFEKYQSSFPKNAKMKGITLLFHGGPGCGKTEFAMQLSKQTGRPLMKIQVTDFQSKWVGESESQLKAIFDDYRMAYDRMKIKPILFLNECDQIIGKRISIGSSVDQMTNALQNILLEEMENFDGIMIGTTNLTENMDSAFERRWIVKLQFNAPNSEARKSIWKSYIKGLRESELNQLVNQFDFTPGEIANIARRFKVEQLLGLKKTKIQTLLSLCETERFIKGNTVQQKSIGFDLNRKAS